MLLVCIFDRKSHSFGAPSLEVNEGTAKRAVAELLYNKQAPFYHHAADFDLMKVGDYNKDTGEIVSDVQFICGLEDIKYAISDDN